MNETLSQKPSKRLHELGFKMDTCNEWRLEHTLASSDHRTWVVRNITLDSTNIPAPTFEELWKVMPPNLNFASRLYINKWDNGVVTAGYEKHSDSEQEHSLSPTEGLGQLAIWLVENGHLGDRAGV